MVGIGIRRLSGGKTTMWKVMVATFLLCAAGFFVLSGGSNFQPPAPKPSAAQRLATYEADPARREAALASLIQPGDAALEFDPAPQSAQAAPAQPNGSSEQIVPSAAPDQPLFIPTFGAKVCRQISAILQYPIWTYQVWAYTQHLWQMKQIPPISHRMRSPNPCAGRLVIGI